MKFFKFTSALAICVSTALLGSPAFSSDGTTVLKLTCERPNNLIEKVDSLVFNLIRTSMSDENNTVVVWSGKMSMVAKGQLYPFEHSKINRNLRADEKSKEDVEFVVTYQLLDKLFLANYSVQPLDVAELRLKFSKSALNDSSKMERGSLNMTIDYPGVGGRQEEQIRCITESSLVLL